MTPFSEQGFRCIAYDRRGHGRPSDPGREQRAYAAHIQRVEDRSQVVCERALNRDLAEFIAG